MKPEIGSRWKARDGRILRVTELRKAGRIAVLWLENARPRQRCVTELAVSNFGNEKRGFLRRVDSGEAA